jgi:hypothetical protein
LLLLKKLATNHYKLPGASIMLDSKERKPQGYAILQAMRQQQAGHVLCIEGIQFIDMKNLLRDYYNVAVSKQFLSTLSSDRRHFKSSTLCIASFY